MYKFVQSEGNRKYFYDSKKKELICLTGNRNFFIGKERIIPFIGVVIIYFLGLFNSFFISFGFIDRVSPLLIITIIVMVSGMKLRLVQKSFRMFGHKNDLENLYSVSDTNRRERIGKIIFFVALFFALVLLILFIAGPKNMFLLFLCLESLVINELFFRIFIDNPFVQIEIELLTSEDK